jgi:hypothetical protein
MYRGSNAGFGILLYPKINVVFQLGGYELTSANIQSQSSFVSLMKSCQKIKMTKLNLKYNICKGTVKSKK